MATIQGALTVVLAGLLQGSGVWPMKLMKKFQFEHWWFIAMLVGLVIAPWIIMITFCPDVWQAYHDVPASTLVKANLCALCMGNRKYFVRSLFCSHRGGPYRRDSDRFGGLGWSHGADDRQRFRSF